MLQKLPRTAQFRETESRRVIIRGMRSYAFLMGPEFQSGMNENVLEMNVLEMNSDDGYAIMRIHLMSLNCTFRNDEDGKFYVMHKLPRFLKLDKQLGTF